VPPLARTQPLPDAVYASLSGQILSGALAPGDPLPSERLLSEEYEVNRHAIREAMKRLQQAGLVRVSHGGATRVLDWRATGGLDLLTQLGASGGLGPELVRSALEMRLSIGADCARRCAQRAPAALVEQMRALTAEQPTGDEQAADAYERLWGLIVLGADNLAYRLALNSLLAASAPFDLRGRSLPEAHDRDAIAELVDAIADGRSEEAESAARDLLERTQARSAAGSSIRRAPEEGSPWSS
jgi:GntR family transcriptional regulator, transcriptional repressor for pyruvate dehydrogenase complex